MKRFSSVVLLLGAVACSRANARGENAETPTPPAKPATTFLLTSPAFTASGPMPKKYTCQGGDTSPPLSWSGAPSGTKTFALILDDPDAPDPAAPTHTHVHWVLSDIPGTATALVEGAAASRLPAGTVTGTNDSGKTAYGGPCPPIGRHRYFHKLYALDEVLGQSAPTKADLERAMQGHVLATAELIGTYQKE